MTTIETQEGEFLVSTDKSKLDTAVIYDYLAHESYWSQNIPRSVVEKSLQGSLCFGLYHHQQQVGFARLITDYATFAYLADVFVLEAYRGRGLSKFLMRCIIAHPDVAGLRRIMLVTSDAHGLYEQFGFTGIPNPEKMMQLHKPDIYTKK
ncbi:GNAT family N-acetyltransferase [Chitinophaga solisilvae]|uniref:GNAT family N-acetyltransferase n=1 Tax=Chitinophaga solisilvae TaxID=1233460 RepID=UPI001369EE7F|nr:GNAT family N-acetyltransferase [Chitinophaga solisilvae]